MCSMPSRARARPTWVRLRRSAPRPDVGVYTAQPARSVYSRPGIPYRSSTARSAVMIAANALALLALRRTAAAWSRRPRPRSACAASGTSASQRAAAIEMHQLAEARPGLAATPMPPARPRVATRPGRLQRLLDKRVRQGTPCSRPGELVEVPDIEPRWPSRGPSDRDTAAACVAPRPRGPPAATGAAAGDRQPVVARSAHTATAAGAPCGGCAPARPPPAASSAARSRPARSLPALSSRALHGRPDVGHGHLLGATTARRPARSGQIICSRERPIICSRHGVGPALAHIPARPYPAADGAENRVMERRTFLGLLTAGLLPAPSPPGAAEGQDVASRLPVRRGAAPGRCSPVAAAPGPPGARLRRAADVVYLSRWANAKQDPSPVSPPSSSSSGRRHRDGGRPVDRGRQAGVTVDPVVLAWSATPTASA